MRNVFVETANAKNFINAMKEGERASGEPALLVFYGRAGRGKTSASRFFAAREGWTYCRALRGWSELWMLQDLCFELMVDPIPGRKKAAFEAIVDRLSANPRPVVIDEADKLSEALIDWVRDLADVTLAPFALVGEKRLLHKMRKERRVWSRTLRAVEFGPLATRDILFFAKKAADLTLTAAQGEILREAAGGDFRLVSRDIRRLEELMAANRMETPSDDTVRLAVKQGLRGA